MRYVCVDGRKREAAFVKTLIKMMIEYNRWANQRLVEDCRAVPNEELQSSFGSEQLSVWETLSRALWNDGVWLARLQGDRQELPLAEARSQDLEDFAERRQFLDNQLMDFADSVTEIKLTQSFVNRTGKEVPTLEQPLGMALIHLSHLQSHHRSQIQTYLAIRQQASQDIGFMTFQKSTGLGMKLPS